MHIHNLALARRRLPGYTAATPAAARAALLRALGSDPAVEYVEEDRRVFAARVPNGQAGPGAGQCVRDSQQSTAACAGLAPQPPVPKDPPPFTNDQAMMRARRLL